MAKSWWATLGMLALLGGCGGGADEGNDAGSGVAVRVSLQRVFTSLPAFSSPVAMLQAPNDGTRWFVVEQDGRVMVFNNLAGVSVATEFIDIAGPVTSGGEMGLLGMAFHPSFPVNPRVYLSYTFDDPAPGVPLVSRISEFRTLDGGLTLDPGTEVVLMTVEQPQTNHNGGQIAFGPGGYLFIGFGDGGGSNDPHGLIGSGQDPTTLLGKMLRIDVSTPGSYGIPPDNPFVASATQCGTNGTGPGSCPEIFAMGFRNPWRWSFDRQTSELWVADVGEGRREEVNRVLLGENYGWRCMEGTLFTGLACGAAINLIPPVVEYEHDLGRSVTGGYVYRGASFPSLVGTYVFGDFISGNIFTIPSDAVPTGLLSRGFDSGLRISSFGQGVNGELYVVDYDGGLYRIVSP